MRLERLLVVDDEPSVRRIVIALLTREGYAVVEAESAEAALLVLEQDAGFDMVLSDLMMSGMDGLELLDRIGAEYAGLPMALFTAVQDIHTAMNAFRRGAVDLLLKPFSRTQLLDVVRRGLEQGRMRMQNTAYWQNLEELVSTRTCRLRATMQDLERSYDTTLEAMGAALDLRDAETEGHSKRVTAYTIAIAREMGLDTEALRVIARGAFLHDIGKIATPDSILLKPDKLDEREMAIMREHCQRGFEMVGKIPFLREASEIVLAHQEKFDGSGYPRGLAGEDIPLGARIFAIADTLDAMTSDRPYRRAQSFAEARLEVARCSGCQFDPEIVSVFLSMPEDGWPALREQIATASPAAALCRPQ